MTGLIIALISGALMSVQGVFNTQVTKTAGIWTANCFVQFTALVTCFAFWIFSERVNFMKVFAVPDKYTLLGGVIGAFITYTVIKSMSMLGTAKAVLIIVVTQIAVAYIIELLGMFGSEKTPFSWTKIGGIALSVIGVIIYSRQ